MNLLVPIGIGLAGYWLLKGDGDAVPTPTDDDGTPDGTGDGSETPEPVDEKETDDGGGTGGVPAPTPLWAEENFPGSPPPFLKTNPPAAEMVKASTSALCRGRPYDAGVFHDPNIVMRYLQSLGYGRDLKRDNIKSKAWIGAIKGFQGKAYNKRFNGFPGKSPKAEIDGVMGPCTLLGLYQAVSLHRKANDLPPFKG